jgi:fucose permease
VVLVQLIFVVAVVAVVNALFCVCRLLTRGRFVVEKRIAIAAYACDEPSVAVAVTAPVPYVCPTMYPTICTVELFTEPEPREAGPMAVKLGLLLALTAVTTISAVPFPGLVVTLTLVVADGFETPKPS